MDDMKILDPESKKFKAGGREITVRPLTFREFRKLSETIISAMETIIEEVPDVDITDVENLDLNKLIPAFMKCGDSLRDILATSLDVDKEVIDEFTLEVISFAILSVFEVNGLESMFANFSQISQMVKEEIKTQ